MYQGWFIDATESPECVVDGSMTARPNLKFGGTNHELLQDAL